MTTKGITPWNRKTIDEAELVYAVTFALSWTISISP